MNPEAEIRSKTRVLRRKWVACRAEAVEERREIKTVSMCRRRYPTGRKYCNNPKVSDEQSIPQFKSPRPRCWPKCTAVQCAWGVIRAYGAPRIQKITRTEHDARDVPDSISERTASLSSVASTRRNGGGKEKRTRRTCFVTLK